MINKPDFVNYSYDWNWTPLGPITLLIVESKKNVLFFSHAARGENVIKKYSCQEWDSNPRLHSETRTLIPASSGKGIPLESGAFDRSAILTTYN